MASVFCGLSGGVDSALACALLVEQGYDVTAVYMRNWSQDLPGFRCPWADDLADAEEAVQSAAINLFSAYNTYLWAVEHGILN